MSKPRRLGPGSAGLGRNQLIHTFGQVLHHEVFFRRRAARIHFLRPGFHRHLDAEGLVYGEDDIQEVQAINAKIT